MRKTPAALLAVLLLLGAPGTVLALSFNNSGQYMFTVSGNDPSNPSADLSSFEAMIEAWFVDQGNPTDVDLDFYAKVDAPATSTTEGTGDLTLTFGDEAKSGEWFAGVEIAFYSVKAGNQYALYWVDPASSSGTWSTEDLFVGRGNHPELSHLSAWVNAGATVHTPEPATLMLLGSGLLGVAAFGRRRRGRRRG